jgi:cyclopropane-fatty-acyl-phospholipid synthase
MIVSDIRSLIEEGALSVRMPGNKAPFGAAGADQAPIAVRIHDNATLRRIMLNPLLEVGEAYMDGRLTLERGDIYDLLELAARRLSNRLSWHGRAGGNSPSAARRNAAHHYDLSGALYELFLDADKQYSCAYFARPGMSLEEAQAAKKRHIAAKLLLSPGQHVLDIGSGWGGLALSLAEQHGVHVTGITLSEEQLAAARKRAGACGQQGRVRFELRDYRETTGVFDRIVSVGMFEHVGPAHYQTFFDTVAARLAPKGVALVHTIGKTAGPARNNPWIEKYIFPGGVIPALSQIAPAIERAGLIITDLEVLRLHYAETLRAWRERFAQHRQEARALYDERFCRMWEFYLAGAEAGFRSGDLVVFQIQLAKDKTAVPLTRDYLYAPESAPASYAIAAE